MNQDVAIMQQIYKTYDYDWLGQKIGPKGILERHHIVKKEYDGENGISNYALLLRRSHQFVHMLETDYPDDFERISNLFLKLNRSMKPPTKYYFTEVRKIVAKHKNDKKSHLKK